MLKKLIMIIFTLSTMLLIFFLGIYPFIKHENVIAIPQICNLTEIEGKEILDSKKIKYEIIYVDGIGDKIKKTVPEANSLIKQSQTITVYVEQKKSEKVKNMVNMTKDDAKIILDDYLNRYNIQYEIVTREVSEGINDVVLEQSIYDTSLDEISKIIITISKCEYYITMPNFVGENYKKAFEFCKENGFLFEGIYVNSILDTDTIIYQETDDGSNLRKNSNNKLLFYIAK